MLLLAVTTLGAGATLSKWPKFQGPLLLNNPAFKFAHDVDLALLKLSLPTNATDQRYLLPFTEINDDVIGYYSNAQDPTNIPKYASNLHQAALHYGPINPRNEAAWLKREIDFCHKFIGEDSATAQKAEIELERVYKLIK